MVTLLAGCQPTWPDSRPFQARQTEYPDILSASIIDTKEYMVQERLTITNLGPGEPSKQNLWIALIGDVYPYQKVAKRVITPEGYRVVTDEYGNQIAEYDFSEMPPGSEIQVKIDYQISVSNLEYDLSHCEGELPNFFTSPELHVESNNPQIINLAGELSKGKRSACDQIRAFYDYIGDNLVYSYNGNDWGAQAALGEMGADCTEYASLMMALSRAAGIPARYIEGVNYIPKNAHALARTEHAWLEVYLPGIGWTPMDPTLGRSSITREDYYAAMPPNHIIVSRGRSPSTLRGSSYWSHIYWPGTSTVIKIQEFEWSITEIE
ncbi:MAG: transglutaminase domain-containing protein [Anaerolineales bacterium]|nr:transglutaminase domain-containing protein [Anaerolineales bacterium]